MSNTLADIIRNKDVMPEDNPVLLGNFAPVSEEQENLTLKVKGTIPAALNGTLLRDGPNPVNPQPNHHWFVGDGMLHAIKFENGKATSYKNRWVRTEALAEKNGLAAAPVSETVLPIQGSGNVNVVYHSGKVLALPEVGLPYEMDGQLQTVGMYDFQGKLASNMTAHPKIDPVTGEMLFFGYEIVAPFLKYHVANAEGELIKSIDIDLPKPIMMHDFGVTATRVIFMDLPVVADFNLAMEGYGMPFVWDDEHQARLGVLNRNADKDEVVWIDIDPCYVFHPLNCYDDGKNIVMDVVLYDKVFTAEPQTTEAAASTMVRWVIDPEQRNVTSSLILGEAQEFPRVNPKVECQKHRYGYCLQQGGPHGFRNLIKYDLEAGSHTYHEVGENNAGGEPIFVSTGDAEDEGYILTVVYNGDTELSEVHIVDAQAFDQPAVAIIELGARVPFGFHGNFAIDL